MQQVDVWAKIVQREERQADTMAQFDVVDVSAWCSEQEELLGARDKLWLSRTTRAPAPEALWKEGRPGHRIAEPGADLWAERIAAEIAPLLGIPAARVDLALRDDRRGVVSWRVGLVLRHGNELLSGLNPEYDAGGKGAVEGYDLDSIRDALRPYRGWEDGSKAFDCFAGLLVLDALIGNTDRHHENWAVLEETGALAPSYDHGASLGFNASGRSRSNPPMYAQRGRSRHFPNCPTLVALAHAALAIAGPAVRADWLDRVTGVDAGRLEHVVLSVPDDWMSDPARRFALELMIANQRRLLS